MRNYDLNYFQSKHGSKGDEKKNPSHIETPHNTNIFYVDLKSGENKHNNKAATTCKRNRRYLK